MANKLSFLKRSLRGLNLIEVVVAIVMFSFIAISLMSIFAQGYRNLRRSRMRHTAYLLAQDKIEELSSGKYVFDHPGALNETKAGLSAPFSDFQREVIVRNPPQGPLSGYSNLSQINVSVFWNGTTAEQNFTLSTLVANQN